MRCLKAFLNWSHQEGIIGQPIKLSWLKEEQKVLATLTPEQAKQIVAYRPASRGANRYGKAVTSEQRLHTLVCLLLDTGLRLSEAINLESGNIDFENLVLKVRGKGSKERLVPFSFEMRKVLFKFLSNVREPERQGPYVFQTRNGTALRPRDVLRDFRKLGKRLGISGVRFSPHTCRHSFAVGYLRNGGNLYYLSRILGHSTIKNTERRSPASTLNRPCG